MLWAATIAACAGPAEEEPLVQLSYEAMPGEGVALGQGAVDTGAAVYDDKYMFTQEIYADLVPDVFATVGLDFPATSSEIAPGGYLLATNPSMQSRSELSTESANTVSAALGYVMYQWSVLVTDFAADEGNTGYAVVRFDAGALDATLAQSFFVHAAGVDAGLGGGYMSFDDTMIFLNLRGSDGVPYSGLDDAAFVAALESAVASFGGAAVTMSESGFVDAWLVENDWSTAPEGTDYLDVTNAAGVSQAALDRLQDTFNQRLLDAAALYGWEPQALARPYSGYGAQPYAYRPRWYNQPLQGMTAR